MVFDDVSMALIVSPTHYYEIPPVDTRGANLPPTMINTPFVFRTSTSLL